TPTPDPSPLQGEGQRTPQGSSKRRAPTPIRRAAVSAANPAFPELGGPLKARHRAVRFPPAPLLLLLLCLTACGRPAEPVVLSGATMGTTWEVKLRELPPGQAADLLQRAVSGVFADVDMA